MTKEQYTENLKKIESDYQLFKNRLSRDYAFANNPYKIGDIFEDHIGKIEITQIRWCYQRFVDYPCCIYEGYELKKDGKKKKNKIIRTAYQSNDTNKSSH